MLDTDSRVSRRATALPSAVRAHSTTGEEVGVIEIRTRKNLERQIAQFRRFLAAVLGYPLRALRDHFPVRPVGTVILGTLLVVYTLALVFFFWRLAWEPFLLPWEGTLDRKETRITPTGNSTPLETFLFKVKNEAGSISEHAVPRQVYLDISEGERLRKPFAYSQILGINQGRTANRQLQDLLYQFMGLLLFLFAKICGNSFIAVIYVSLFLHDPRKTGRVRA